VLLTDSGTTALTAALIGVLRDHTGAAAALPAFSCFDVATAADGADVRVRLYDVDQHSLAPDAEHVRAVLRAGARAIVVVHHYGVPVDLTDVNLLAADAGAVVIEDAAQAADATIRGRPAGAQTSLAVLSFGRGKGLTGGGGGALLAHDDAGVLVLDRARAMLGSAVPAWPDFGSLVAQLVFARPSVYGLPASVPWLHLGRTLYREPRPLRAPSAVCAPVVAATWADSDREGAVRRRHAEQLLGALHGNPALHAISVAGDVRPGYLRLPVLCSTEAHRAAQSPVARRLGIMPSYPAALCDLARFAPRRLDLGQGFPGARKLAAHLCTLPTHSRLTAVDLARLLDWIRAQ
jgi:dTDP-4-amino-4,6-dideoxygalactose transaminase